MKFKLGPLEITLPPFNVPVFLAVVITLGFMLLIAKICFQEVPAGSKEIAFAMTGSISTWVGIMVGYHFGSSSGSARKTDLLKSENPKA